MGQINGDSVAARADARTGSPIVVAHRGASTTHPENTIPAFEEAARLGAEMIEWDVYPTIDGQLVIIHDSTVDRTTDGKGKIRDLTWDEVSKLDAGAWKSEAFKGVRVPTLDQALAVLPDWMRLNCHLKLEANENPRYTLDVIGILREHDMAGRTLIVTHVPEIVKTVQDLAKDFEPVLLPANEGGIDYLDRCSKIGTRVLQPRRHHMNAEFIAEMHARGMVGNVFYANSPEDVLAYTSLGVDGILTDDPSTMIETLKNGPG